MSLTLLQPPPCPVAQGDEVTVVETLRMPSGRALHRGTYAVLAVEDTPPEHAALGRYRLLVEARVSRPRGHGHEPVRVWLYPGDFVRYATDPDN